MSNTVIQLIGFFSTALSLISFQQKSRKRILCFQMAADNKNTFAVNDLAFAQALGIIDESAKTGHEVIL